MGKTRSAKSKTNHRSKSKAKESTSLPGPDTDAGRPGSQLGFIARWMKEKENGKGVSDSTNSRQAAINEANKGIKPKQEPTSEDDSEVAVVPKSKSAVRNPKTFTAARAIFYPAGAITSDGGTAHKVTTMALTELEACGLNVTTTRDGQPIVFDRDASDVDMMTLMHSLFPEAHEYVDDLIAREPLERDRNKHALIPAFRKRSTVQMLDAKTKYNARYVYESFPVGHKRNGLLIGVSAVAIPQEQLNEWARERAESDAIEVYRPKLKRILEGTASGSETQTLKILRQDDDDDISSAKSHISIRSTSESPSNHSQASAEIPNSRYFRNDNHNESDSASAHDSHGPLGAPVASGSNLRPRPRPRLVRASSPVMMFPEIESNDKEGAAWYDSYDAEA